MRLATLLRALAVLPFATIATTRPVYAAWPNSPLTNRQVTGAVGDQAAPTIASDGAGGVIIAWYDYRVGSLTDIYAQHVLASGVIDPAWPVNGLAVCTAASDQYNPVIVSDGAGGAIVAWFDYRSGNADIYAQHVFASGVVDPAWPADGRALCTAAGTQNGARIVSDDAGGAIVSWQDIRNTVDYDVYAQRVLASGTVDPAWPSNGRELCTAGNGQYSPAIVSDGSGGAIVTWEDDRVGGSQDVYAQRVLASGAVDPGWPVNGRAISTAASLQLAPTITSDGAGGALIAWHDYRVGNPDIYAQHVLASGVVDQAWPVNGRAQCTAGGSQFNPVIASDGAGGAIVAWEDQRVGAQDVYAQHVLANGDVDAAWPADGRVLCTAMNGQIEVRIESDGAGGAFVAWTDFRVSVLYGDIYAHHVLASGAADPSWPVNGRAVCTAGYYQSNPAILADDSGGLILTWYDGRGGSGAGDIYAQRVGRYSYLGTPEAEIVSVADVPGDQGGKVKVSWNASYLESDPYNLVTSYRVFRSVPPNLAQAMLRDGAQVLAAGGEDAMLARPGALVATVSAGTTYFWEYLATVAVDYLPNYSYLAPTAQDSTSQGAPLTAFMVQARTPGSQHWESLPATGYSVDDLAPQAPAPFTAVHASGVTHLHWGRNAEGDLAGYRLYRGSFPGFVPGPGNLVTAQPDTGYDDAAGPPGSWYKLSAIDVHDNESVFAVLGPDNTVDVPPSTIPRALAFGPPAPNPVSGENASFRFVLPGEAPVTLSIHDPQGRRLRELARGVHPAGDHRIAWDGRDEDGRLLASGVYFARLEAMGRVMLTRFAIVR